MDFARRPSPAVLLVAVLTAGHFFWLAHYVYPAYAAPDADGYYAQARLILQEGRLTFEPASPAQHLGMHWLEKPDGSFISRYPAGLPVLIGAVWAVAGRDATMYVNAALAALTLPALYLLAAPFLGPWPALAAVVVQAANPTANFHAIHADAHTGACFFLVLGWMLLDRWRRSGARWLGFLGGFSLAVVPTIRYAEAAAVVGAIIFLAVLWRIGRRDILWPILGALPPGLAMAAVNTAQFGAPWRTAYRLTGESNLRWEYFLRNWNMYIESILTSGVGLFAVLGALGALVMLRDRETRPIALGLGLSAFAITLVYMFYYSAGGGAERFLLPTMPLYLPPAIWFMHRAVAGRAFAVALCALTVLQAGIGMPEGLQRMRSQGESSKRSAAYLAGLEEFVPKGAVLLADVPMQEVVHFTGEWKQADLSLFRQGGGRMGRRPGGFLPFPGSGGDEDRPSAMQRDKGKELRARYEGLDSRERTALLLADLEAWANPDSEIYLAASENGSNESFRAIQRAASLTPVGVIELPESPSEPQTRRGRRRPGGPGMGGPGGFIGFPGGPGGFPGGPGGGLPGMMGGGPLGGIPAGRITIYQVSPR